MSALWNRGLPAVLVTFAAQEMMSQTPAQPTACTLVGQRATRLSADTLPGGQHVAFIGGGVILKCPSRGITITSDSAERHPDKDFLVGNVVVKLVDGRTLKSPHLIYNQITRTISSDTTYSITGKQGEQRGVGFRSNRTFTSFRCLANCGGDFKVLVPKL